MKSAQSYALHHTATREAGHFSFKNAVKRDFGRSPGSAMTDSLMPGRVGEKDLQLYKPEQSPAETPGAWGRIKQFYWDHQLTCHLLGGAFIGAVLGGTLCTLTTKVLVDAAVTGAVAGVMGLAFTGEEEFTI